MKMRLVVGMIFMILFAGCSTKMAPQKIYTLQTPEVNTAYKKSDKNKTIMVMQPQSLKEVMSQKMRFSYSSTEQGAYLNSKWSNDLGKLFQGTLIYTLQSSGMFKGVVSYASTAQADYRLESTIFDFSHHVRDNASHAIVSIQFTLVSTHTGKLVKSRRFSYSEATKTTDAEGYVEATNRALGRLSSDLLLWLQ